MKKYIIRRFLQLIPVLILVSIFSFFIIKAAPGDPFQVYEDMGMEEEQIEKIREAYGMDGNIIEQYLAWVKHAIKGDLGLSITQKKPVVDLILERLPATLTLMGTALALSIVLAIPLGLIAGYKKNTWIDNAIRGMIYLGISIPHFWLAMVLIIVFALKLHIFPTGGMYTIGAGETFGDLVHHLIMPAFVLSLNKIAVFTKYIRSNTISQLEEDYILTAVSKGTSKMKVLFKHVLKNCLLPIITLVGMNLAGLVCGSFVVESIFLWPGIGRLAMTAVSGRDYNLIMGFTMFSCLILIIGNFIADILYAVADPRIRQGMEKSNE